MTNSEILPTANIYDWSSGRHREIRSNLDGLRIDIAEFLEIDPLENQLVRVPEAPDPPIGNSVSAYIEHRKIPGATVSVLRIKLVLDELEGMLCKFVMESHNLNRQASEAGVYNALKVIAARDEITGDEIENLDFRVRELIANYYPGEPEALQKDRFKPSLVIEAAQAALADIPTPKRGRPKGTNNKAAKKLIRKLGNIYRAYSSKRPSRSVFDKVIDGIVVAQIESGRFTRFCELVIEALPKNYQDQITKAGGGLASLIRNEVSRK